MPPAATTATPFPLSVTGEPLTPAFEAVMVTLPFAEPTAPAGGENTTLIVQVKPAPKLAPQVPPAAPAGCENGAVTTTAIPVIVTFPLLCNVSVDAALVVP